MFVILTMTMKQQDISIFEKVFFFSHTIHHRGYTEMPLSTETLEHLNEAQADKSIQVVNMNLSIHPSHIHPPLPIILHHCWRCGPRGQ